MVGKWHLGFESWAHTPNERGFDSYFGFYAGSTDYYTQQSECWAGPWDDGCFQKENGGEPVTGSDLRRDRIVVPANLTGEYSTQLFTREAERIIAAHGASETSAPLFLYLAHQAVHVGNAPTPSHPEYGLDQAPMRYIEQYAWVAHEERRNLSGMVAALDESVGNVTSALRAAGMWHSTLLVFSTDNGGPTAHAASNYPLKGGKGTCWEGGARGVGFVTAGTQLGLPSHIESHALIHVTDWAASPSAAPSFLTVCRRGGPSRVAQRAGAMRCSSRSRRWPSLPPSALGVTS